MDQNRNNPIPASSTSADESQRNVNSQKKEHEEPGDWILELFAPYENVDDLVERQKVKDEFSRIRVSAFDPMSVRNVYERMQALFQQKEADHKIAEQTHVTLDLAVGKAVAQRELPSTDITEEVDLVDSKLWNSEELSVLRGVFRAARKQISGLEVKLRQTQRQNTELEEKLASATQALENKTKKLSEATKANHRLKILCDELQMDQKALEMKLAAFTDMWKEIDGEKIRMMKETQQAHILLNQERLAHQQLQIQFQEMQQEMLTEQHQAENRIKTRYEQRILKLEEHAEQLLNELSAEKEMHHKDKKALDHLRIHFTSLPLQSILPANVIVADEIQNIDHLIP